MLHLAPAPPALKVSEQDYLDHYAHDHYEWLEGELIPPVSVHDVHDDLSQFFIILLRAYLNFRQIGVLRTHPFVMRHPQGRSFREPDLMLILNEHRDRLKPTLLLGPADLAIEIISPESEDRDYEVKFAEYARMGVPEYWIIDPYQPAAHFYRLDEAGGYQEQTPAEGVYSTPLLPDFRLQVELLWQSPLADILQIVAMVKTMLGEG
jgi:Uma2 family endonuclease